MKKLALAISALALCSNVASAADMEARPYRAAPMIAAIFDWSGFYYGANAGYGSSRKCWDLITTTGTFIGSEGCHSATGAVAGFQAGYRTQSSAWVFGVEAQGDWAQLSGSSVSNAFFFAVPGDVTNRSRIRAFGLFTGQVGFALGNALLYVKGGGAVVADRYSDVQTGSGLLAATATEPRFGGTAGVGLEYGFAPNLSFGIVYDHLFMGTKNLLFTSLGVTPGVAAAGAGISTDRIRQDMDLITVRINYTFGGPSIAKY